MKPLFVISCPIDTYSGYGARSRDIVKAIIELNKYDVRIVPQRWGNTPWGFIDDHQEWEFLKPYILPDSKLPRQPDIFAQITVPNEFQRVGKFNIGITAGIETTVCDASWILGCNKMDHILVSSDHAKEVFETCKFEQVNQQTGEKSGIELRRPVDVIFEGAHVDLYTSKSSFNLDDVKEDFAYLFVGHWMQGILGEDRKNVGLLIRNFLDTFKNKKNTPALILKTYCAGASYMDRSEIIKRINSIKDSIEAKSFPNIYLLHGELSDKEIGELYNHKKVKAMVSLTKGEGFGRPLLEFSLTKKPILSTNWSGHTDFLNSEFTTLVSGELTNVHKSAAVKNILLEEGKWFTPNYNEVSHYLKDIFNNYADYKEKAVRQAYISRTKFSFEEMKKILGLFLDKHAPSLQKEVQLELPSLSSLKKIKLPKVNS